jgi:hypothetical protein
MAFAGTDSDHWLSPTKNETEIPDAPTQRDFKWEYEGDEALDATLYAQDAHDIVYEATNYNEWDLADELYDQSDDEWLIDCMGKDLINKEDEC